MGDAAGKQADRLQLLGLDQLFLHFFALGDVDHHPLEEIDQPFVIAFDHRALIHPADLAVPGDDPVFQVEMGSAAGRIRAGFLGYPLQVFRQDYGCIGERAGEELFPVVAELAHVPGYHLHRPSRSRPPAEEDHRTVFHHQIAQAQGVFHPLALGYVPGKGAVAPLSLGFHEIVADFHREDHAVFPPVAGFQDRGSPVPQFEMLSGQNPFISLPVGVDVGNGHGQQLLPRIAQAATGRVVHRGDFAPPVDPEAGVEVVIKGELDQPQFALHSLALADVPPFRYQQSDCAVLVRDWLDGEIHMAQAAVDAGVGQLELYGFAVGCLRDSPAQCFPLFRGAAPAVCLPEWRSSVLRLCHAPVVVGGFIGLPHSPLPGEEGDELVGLVENGVVFPLTSPEFLLGPLLPQRAFPQVGDEAGQGLVVFQNVIDLLTAEAWDAIERRKVGVMVETERFRLPDEKNPVRDIVFVKKLPQEQGCQMVPRDDDRDADVPEAVLASVVAGLSLNEMGFDEVVAFPASFP